MVLALEFVIRYLNDRPVRNRETHIAVPNTLTTPIKLMLFGLTFSSTVIFIRCVLLTICLAVSIAQ